MNEIKTVDFTTRKDIEALTPEQLVPEINSMYHQMEAVGSVALMMMAETGRLLIAAKNKVAHGQFENWCENHLDFSKSKAEKMMQLAERVGDQRSIFSKAETFTDLGISKVMALLAAPEEIAAEVIESGDAEEMSVRELKDEIRALKEKHAAEISGLQTKIADAEGLIASEKTKENEQSAEIIKLKDSLKELRAGLETARAKNQELREDMEDKIEEAVEKAKAEAAAEYEASASQSSSSEQEASSSAYEKEIEELQAEKARLESQLRKSGNEALVEFRIQSKAMQQCFNECARIMRSIASDKPELSNKMREGLKQILTAKMKELV